MFKKLILMFLITFTFSSVLLAQEENEAAFLKRQSALVKMNRERVIRLSDYLQNNKQILRLRDLPKRSALSNDERSLIREAWAMLLNSHLELNIIIKEVGAKENKANAFTSDEYFTIMYAAYLAQYRSAIDFIRAMRKVPSTDLVLNEPIKELGLEKDMFAKFKHEYLNMIKFTEYSGYRLEAMAKRVEISDLHPGIESDIEVIASFNRYKGFFYTLKNAGKISNNLLFKMYFPIQKNISEWMGDERVARGDTFLINQEQIKIIHSKLEAGDVLIERREWYLSNIGLPGFWPHSALYLGRPEERTNLEQDEDIKQWVREEGVLSGSFEELLKERYPEVYAESLTKDNYDHPYRVLEAMSEGVVFTSLEHSANADSLAVIRPRLSKLDIAKGLLTSLKYKGRPYDFNFDFRTDSEVVCSELIYYTYQPSSHKNGLSFPITMTLGRPVVTPNNIIKDLSNDYGTAKQQFDFVLFLDGNDKQKRANFSDMENLKTTWNRPKWFIFIQDKE